MIIVLNEGYTVKKIHDLTWGNIDKLLFENEIVMQREGHHVLMGEVRNTSIANWIHKWYSKAIKRVMINEYIAGLEEYESNDKLDYIIGKEYHGLYLIKSY